MRDKLKYYIELALLRAVCFIGYSDEQKATEDVPVVKMVTVGSQVSAGQVLLVIDAIDVGQKVNAGSAISKA